VLFVAVQSGWHIILAIMEQPLLPTSPRRSWGVSLAAAAILVATCCLVAVGHEVMQKSSQAKGLPEATSMTSVLAMNAQSSNFLHLANTSALADDEVQKLRKKSKEVLNIEQAKSEAEADIAKAQKEKKELADERKAMEVEKKLEEKKIEEERQQLEEERQQFEEERQQRRPEMAEKNDTAANEKRLHAHQENGHAKQLTTNGAVVSCNTRSGCELHHKGAVALVSCVFLICCCFVGPVFSKELSDCRDLCGLLLLSVVGFCMFIVAVWHSPSLLLAWFK